MCPICQRARGAYRSFKHREHQEGGLFLVCVWCYCIITKEAYDAARMWERKLRELEEKTQDLLPPDDTVHMTNTKHGTAKSGAKEYGSKSRKEEGKLLRAHAKAALRNLNKAFGGPR